MGDSKLCLLLLLSTSALAFAQDVEEDVPTCLCNGHKVQDLHKYEYRYEAESLNAINGASTLKNGPKGSCMYIVRTTGCMLSEVADMDTEGTSCSDPPPAPTPLLLRWRSTYPLKVVVEGVYDVKLYPRKPTIHGMCKTHSTVNAREDIATDITLNRDLSKCEEFLPGRIWSYHVGKQELTLVEVTPHNDRVFDHSEVAKGLHMEAVQDKSAVQDKMQVLAQCGTPECSSAIMQILRTFDSSAVEVDAAVFALGLVSIPLPS
ncbi:unnamed protein product [Pleuronectes platessa]|uniref:Uncharacterized protein n=1 Tax=Pleuronectes platessa TaxID=8262 RepID=A0A9N7YT69_PLEPL|nr:unnamed protein product [Pleuronectes platessa]